MHHPRSSTTSVSITHQLLHNTRDLRIHNNTNSKHRNCFIESMTENQIWKYRFAKHVNFEKKCRTCLFWRCFIFIRIAVIYPEKAFPMKHRYTSSSALSLKIALLNKTRDIKNKIARKDRGALPSKNNSFLSRGCTKNVWEKSRWLQIDGNTTDKSPSRRYSLDWKKAWLDSSNSRWNANEPETPAEATRTLPELIKNVCLINLNRTLITPIGILWPVHTSSEMWLTQMDVVNPTFPPCMKFKSKHRVSSLERYPKV